MILIACDIHRNILSVQSFIHYKTKSLIDNIQVIAKTNCLTFHFYYKSSLKQHLKLCFTKDVLIPSSVSFVRCLNSEINPVISKDENVSKWNCSSVVEQVLSPNEKVITFEITFRLQISNDNLIQNCISKVNENIKFKTFMKDQCEKLKECYIVCTNCKCLLIGRSLSFHSIRTYDENSSELAENWFCHKHDNDSSLEGKAYILYISNTYLYFHDSVVRYLNLSESNKEYKCNSCSSLLSLKKKINSADFTGFFCDKILLRGSKLELKDTEKHRSEYAMFSFFSVLKDILETALSCKIYIQSKINDKIECLLLWINSQEIAQFLYEEINDDNIPDEIEFKTKEVFKVLYSIVPSTSELAKTWQRDFNVEFMQVSDNTMKVVCQLLQESAKCFPSNQETVNGFLFGYLPADVYPTIL